jgi:hypothetical protein
VGIASVAVTVLGVGAGWCLPESHNPAGRVASQAASQDVSEDTEQNEAEQNDAEQNSAGGGCGGRAASREAPEKGNAEAGTEADDDGESGATYAAVLRSGVAELRGAPPVRRALVLVAALMGFGALDEYLPLLAESTGVGPATVSLLMVLVMAGMAIGGWAAGRGRRWAAPALAVAAGCLAAGAAIGHPAGLVLVAVTFGILEWAMVDADARLQERISDDARATVTSMAGLGAEVMAVLTFAGYALGSTMAQPGLLFTLAAAPCLLLSLAVWRSRIPGVGTRYNDHR